MAARLKSSVLRREERGFGSVSMGRLLVSGMSSGAVFLLASLLKLRLLMIPLSLIVLVAGLVLTNPRHGIPLYLYLWVTVRARLLLASTHHPNGWQAQLVKGIGWKAEALVWEGESSHATLSSVGTDTTLDAWEILPDSSLTQGFEVVTDTFYLEG